MRPLERSALKDRLRGLAALATLLLAATGAQAIDYVFPDNMPNSCKGSAGIYTCGQLTLGYNDTVTIASFKPATITIGTKFVTDTVKINADGKASDLTLIVTGPVTPGYAAVINANVQATTIDGGASSAVIWGGSITITTGSITLGYGHTVAGSLVSSSGNIFVGNANKVAGSISSTSGAVELDYAAEVAGSIGTSGTVTLAGSTVVRGNITGATGNVSVGYGAELAEVTTSSGAITLAGGTTASCARSTASAKIVLDFGATVTGVCCGASCGNSCVANNTGQLMPLACVSLIARYDFEETGWKGTVGELKDTAGYGGPYNGRAQGSPLPSAASTTPARSGSAGTCGYAVLPGPTNNGGGFIVSGLPVSTAAGAKTSVAFWMYWDGTSNVMPIGWHAYDLWLQGGGFGFNTNASDVYGIANASLVRTWKHVVAVFTNGGVTSNKLYIDGVPQTLSHQTSSRTPNAANAVVGSALRIGGFGANTSYRMAGRIDQVRVYNGELKDSDAISAYKEALPCDLVAGPDHYEISLPTTSLSCLPTTVTVTACATSGTPCTNVYTAVSGATALLATTTGTLAATTITFNASGVATTTLSHPTAANATAVSVTLSGESTAATSARQCCPNGSSCAAANSCATTFNTAGFIIAAANGGTATTIPSQTAGTGSAGHFLRAVQTSTTTKACEAAITGVGSVNWSATCNNPTTCSAGNRMTVTGNAAVAVAGNANGSSGSSTAVAMTFDANGNAPFSFNYADVGQITLNASRAAGGSLLTALSGSSNAFVVRPGGFAVSGIRQTAAPQLVNPAAASAAGSRFIKAGEAFSATVTAQTSGGATTPNYGRETAPEGVLLTRALVLPAAGAAGTLSNGSIAGGSFSSGVATVTNLAFSEVGIITLSPAVADSDYLGAGNVTGTASGNIGRFIPAQFALSSGSVTHRSALSCAPASAFSYLGENFRLGFTLTAQNTAGATTTNYSGAFARLDPTSATWNLAGRDATNVFTVASARLSLGSATGSFSNGVASGITLTANAARAAAPDGPFSASFGIAPVDSDGVAMAAFDTASAAGAGNDRTGVATVPLRFGRLRLGSAAGAADRVLALPVTAQHWNGTAFDTNTLDSCTAVATTAMNFGNLRGTLTTADTAASGAITLASGAGALRLAAPGGGRSGTYDVALSLGSSATDASCLQSWMPGAGDVATVGANLAYLRGNFCASTYSNDPAARATFGRQRGVDNLVYRRENF